MLTQPIEQIKKSRNNLVGPHNRIYPIGEIGSTSLKTDDSGKDLVNQHISMRGELQKLSSYSTTYHHDHSNSTSILSKSHPSIM
jgi:hypothetical protein